MVHSRIPLNYRYTESGLPNVVLQGVSVADCPVCGNTEVAIPRIGKLHRTIAHALTMSPARLTGAELRFLRKHLVLSGEEFGRYLHTDKTKISKWETEADKIGPATDRLIRLLVTALDKELSPQVPVVAEHLAQIRDEPGSRWELNVDVHTLAHGFSSVFRAA
jgi:putative zinc finger/helix-turn-helix YgiT family protein